MLRVRRSTMRAYYCHRFELPLPPAHRFPMAKYRLLYERLAQNAERIGVTLHEPAAASDEDLLRVHTPDYVQRMSAGTIGAEVMRRIGFPWSAQMIERSRRSSGATMAALEHVVRGGGIAANLAGGTHHAYADHGGGYCVFNDSVVAARHVQALGLARRVLVIDLDVHQGNGTAALCHDDPSIFTFSMHAQRNYPAVKECSDLDVGLPDGCDDATYLDQLAGNLRIAMDSAQADAAIYLAGADPYREDRLGYLNLSKAGLRERDRMVFNACLRSGIPVAVSMAGGYAEAVEDIVDIHYATIALAAELSNAAATEGASRQSRNIAIDAGQGAQQQ